MDDDGGVLYLVISGAPAPEGIPALVAACQAAGWRVVVFSTATGVRFVDPAELERLTGEPVRSEYRMPGTSAPVPPADAVLACPPDRPDDPDVRRREVARPGHGERARGPGRAVANGGGLFTWRTLGQDAILQPPKPSIAPSTRLLQCAFEHDIEPEAGG